MARFLIWGGIIRPVVPGANHAAPHPPLPSPIRHSANGPHLPLAHSSPPAIRARQKQYRLLDIRREKQQAHDLADAGAGDVSQARQVGVARDLRPSPASRCSRTSGICAKTL